MKKNKLKPFLTGSVLILPALLLLNGNGQETKAMMKGAVGKLVGNMKINRITIPSTTGGVKLSSPGVQNAVKRSNSTPNTTTSKFTGPKTNATTSHSFNLGSKVTNPGSLDVKTKRPAPQPPTSSSTLVNKVNDAGITGSTSLTPKRPAPPPPTSNKLTSNSGNLNNQDPGYDTVPKPIFTPKKPGASQPEPEQYQNVVLLNTNAGTLTIFKDH